MSNKKVIIALSHPIQYFSPLFQRLEEQKEQFIKVVYFTDHTLGGLDRQFGQKITWDIPLLKGYSYHFIKNYSPRPAVSGSFMGLINPGIFSYLRKERPDYLIVHGWGYLSNWLTFISAKMLGIPVLMRAESPQKQEKGKSKWVYWFKKWLLGFFCHRFLYIGQSNKAFYKKHGAKENQLFFTPYSVDNDRFRQDYLRLKDQKANLRSKHGIAEDEIVFLFVGKYIPKKRPLDLIRAFGQLDHPKARLIMVGEGALRKEMETYIQKHQLDKVTLTGFVNQSAIAEYYTLSDVFVLPSGIGETWGLVVNEAMNFDLPLIISDMVGCTDDLVIEGQNGYTFPCGDVDQLKSKMERMIREASLLPEMGRRSSEMISRYSYDTIIEGIKKATA